MADCHAQQFFERMSTRRPLAADLLRKAAAAYGDAAQATKRLSEVLPFSHEANGPITDEEIIEQAAALLAQARDAESQAMSCLTDITKIQVRRPPAANHGS